MTTCPLQIKYIDCITLQLWKMLKILFRGLANLKYIFPHIPRNASLYFCKEQYKVHHTNSRENLESDIFIFSL